KYDQLRTAHPTHHFTKSNSQINFIWSSGDVISNFAHCNIEDVLPSVSDHSIVILKIDNFLAAKSNKRNIPTKIVFDYEKISDNKWRDFSNKTDTLANGCQLRALNNRT
ncbi:8505_t:CDS:1, partial [Funneliformis geosporum]